MLLLVQKVNIVLSSLTLVGDVIIGISLILLFLFWRTKHYFQIFQLFKKYCILLAFIVSLIAISGSLFYSEIAGYEPCKLCWYQRIFMYPQAFLFGMALWRKERSIVDYSIMLSLIGAVIAIYHYYLQFAASPLVPCSAIGYSASCSQRFVLQLGYITIPMMALTAFLLITLFMVITKYTVFKAKTKAM